MTPHIKPDIHSNRHIETLPSGLTLFLYEIRDYPVVMFDMWIRAGSRDELPHEYGMSHFLEHMVFNGNDIYSKDEYKREIFKIGGQDNAGTWEDVTNYYVMVTSDHLSSGLDLHHALLTSPRLETSEFTRERDVVIEEIKMYEDDPEDMVGEKSMCSLFSGIGYNHSILGTVETLGSMTPEMMGDYFNNFYVPGNMMLVVIGDFDTNEILPVLREKYSGVKKPLKREAISFKSEPVNGPKIIKLSGDIDATYISINFAAPPFRSMETYALDVLMEGLGGVRSSRLNARLFEELNLVTDIEAGNNSFMDASKLGIDAELKDTSNLKPVLQEIFKILTDVTGNGLSEEEVEHAKTRLIADTVFDKETFMGIGDFYGMNLSIGNLELTDNLIDRTASVTKEQVLDVARRYLRPGNMVLGVNLPEKESDVEITVDNFKPASEARAGLQIPHGEITTRIGKSVTECEGCTDVIRETLPNGVVWLYRNNPVNPAVAFQVYVRGGLAYETWRTNGISEVMQRALRKGTKDKSVEELNKAIDALGIRINADCQRDYLTVKGLSLSRDFKTGFELLAEIILEPAFPESEVLKVKDEVLGVIKSEEDDTGLVAAKRLRLELFGQDHPYGRPTSGRDDSVRILEVSQIRNHHSTVYSPDNLVVSISGDISESVAREMVEKLFGNIEGNGSSVPEVLTPANRDEGKLVKIRREKSQVRIFLGRTGPSLYDPDYPAANVMNTILGGTSYSRLFNVLRDEQGLAYSTYSWLMAGRYPGLFTSFIGTSPENFDRAIEGIKNEYRKLGSERPTEDELESSINSLRGSRLISRIGNHRLASQLGKNEALKLPYDFDLKILEEYKKVSIDDVMSVAEKYCDPDSLIISACGAV